MYTLSSRLSSISRALLPSLQIQQKINWRNLRVAPSRYSSTQLYKMAATDASEVLSQQLRSLSVLPLPQYPNCYPEVNPVDVYRAHLTSLLAEVTGVDSAIIYPALQWTQKLELGDLVLPVPALRVKGKKPQELAAEWIEKVCFS